MRRLWHAHISLKVAENISVYMIDCLITCEIPDPEEDPELYNLVAMFMVHGPCGSFNKSCPLTTKSTASGCLTLVMVSVLLRKEILLKF